jgi:hypothetical protein
MVGDPFWLAAHYPTVMNARLSGRVAYAAHRPRRLDAAPRRAHPPPGPEGDAPCPARFPSPP